MSDQPQPQKTVGGINAHNLQEMKARLARLKEEPTDGLQPFALKERQDKINRYQDEIREAEKKLKTAKK